MVVSFPEKSVQEHILQSHDLSGKQTTSAALHKSHSCPQQYYGAGEGNDCDAGGNETAARFKNDKLPPLTYGYGVSQTDKDQTIGNYTHCENEKKQSGLTHNLDHFNVGSLGSCGKPLNHNSVAKTAIKQIVPNQKKPAEQSVSGAVDRQPFRKQGFYGCKILQVPGEKP